MPLEPSDYEEIRQLLAQYNFAIDFGNIEQWVDTFTADGSFTCLGLPEDAPLGGHHEGKGALRVRQKAFFDKSGTRSPLELEPTHRGQR